MRHAAPPERAAHAAAELEWGPGGATIYRREAFEAVGGFDELFAWYCEDMDFGHRVRGAGWRCLRVDGAFFRHPLGRQPSFRRFVRFTEYIMVWRHVHFRTLGHGQVVARPTAAGGAIQPRKPRGRSGGYRGRPLSPSSATFGRASTVALDERPRAPYRHHNLRDDRPALELCLKSIAQTVANVENEVVVVDCQSADGSAEMATEAGAKVLVRGWTQAESLNSPARNEQVEVHATSSQ